MTLLLLFAVTISFIELALALRLLDRGRRITGHYRKVFRVLGSRHVSDHWKERVLPRYAGLMIRDSLTAFAVLLLCCAPALLAAEWSRHFYPPFQSLLYSWTGIAAMTIFAALYVALRRRWIGR